RPRSFVDQRDLGVRHRTRVLVEYSSAHSTVIRLSVQCEGEATHRKQRNCKTFLEICHSGFSFVRRRDWERAVRTKDEYQVGCGPAEKLPDSGTLTTYS